MGSFLQLLYVSLKTICGCAHSEHSQLKQILRYEPYRECNKRKKEKRKKQWKLNKSHFLLLEEDFILNLVQRLTGISPYING